MSISPGQLLIIALIIVLLFGTKKLRSMGSDLGAALKGFKKAMNDNDSQKDATQEISQQEMKKTPDADFASTSLSNESMSNESMPHESMPHKPKSHEPKSHESMPQEKHSTRTQPVKNQDNEQV